MDMDITTMADSDLAALATQVSAEQTRRATLAQTVAQVAALTRAYTAAGGDVTILTAAVADPASVLTDGQAAS